jgi:NAD(P)-dependent dehydrogenase (short-subunit alcohol dehydrogenase family)
MLRARDAGRRRAALAATGGALHGQPAAVTDRVQVAAVVDRAFHDLGGMRIMTYNYGAHNPFDPIEEVGWTKRVKTIALRRIVGRDRGLGWGDK